MVTTRGNDVFSVQLCCAVLYFAVRDNEHPRVIPTVPLCEIVLASIFYSKSWLSLTSTAVKAGDTPSIPVGVMRVEGVEPPQPPPGRELRVPTEGRKNGGKVVDVRDSTKQFHCQVFPGVPGDAFRSFGEDARQDVRLRQLVQ